VAPLFEPLECESSGPKRLRSPPETAGTRERRPPSPLEQLACSFRRVSASSPNQSISQPMAAARVESGASQPSLRNSCLRCCSVSEERFPSRRSFWRAATNWAAAVNLRAKVDRRRRLSPFPHIRLLAVLSSAWGSVSIANEIFVGSTGGKVEIRRLPLRGQSPLFAPGPGPFHSTPKHRSENPLDHARTAPLTIPTIGARTGLGTVGDLLAANFDKTGTSTGRTVATL
jgi:hypothetical protein